MLNPRIIPCLLIHNKGLVKTVKFKDPKYVGDPINAVRIFNEKEVDELIVLDIDASVQKKEPNYKLIEYLAHQCRMPLCYGGGIKTVEQAKKIFSLGVEKVAISSAAIEDISIINVLAQEVGSQSIVAVLDIKKRLLGNKYDLYTGNGKVKQPIDLKKFVIELQNSGVGEIVINSIDNDGLMKGFNYALIDDIKNNVTVPVTIMGGAGSLDDVKSAIARYKLIGVAAGSLFIFKGKYRAVLINYPNSKEKENIINQTRL